jgi:hypothetical protein
LGSRIVLCGHRQITSDSKVRAIVATNLGATRSAIALAEFFSIKIEIVRSAHEFGMRIGSRVSAGITESRRVSEKLTVNGLNA